MEKMILFTSKQRAITITLEIKRVKTQAMRHSKEKERRPHHHAGGREVHYLRGRKRQRKGRDHSRLKEREIKSLTSSFRKRKETSVGKKD